MNKIRLKPINNRFKRLIHDHGEVWLVESRPRAMSCFNGQLGVTAHPIRNVIKFSNFLVKEIEELKHV